MVTKKQWIELHSVCLDPIRSAIAGLPDEKFSLKPLGRGNSIGEEINHVIGAEAYWLQEAKIEPAFHRLNTDAWSESNFLAELRKIEGQYENILDEKDLDKNILFGLARVSQHALHHRLNIVKLRKAFEPEWKPPTWPATGSWERAVDFISNLLIT